MSPRIFRGTIRERTGPRKNDSENVPVMPVQLYAPNTDSDLQLARTAMSPRIFAEQFVSGLVHDKKERSGKRTSDAGVAAIEPLDVRAVLKYRNVT